MDTVIKELKTTDLIILKELILLYEEAFEMSEFTMPSDDHLQTLLGNPGMIFYVVLLNREVIGGLTAHILPSTYFESSEVYIYDLAVKAEHQRKGVGKRLIYFLRERCLELGYKEVFVQADEDDLHAKDFYRSTGGIAEEVVHFSYPVGVQ